MNALDLGNQHAGRVNTVYIGIVQEIFEKYSQMLNLRTLRIDNA